MRYYTNTDYEKLKDTFIDLEIPFEEEITTVKKATTKLHLILNGNTPPSEAYVEFQFTPEGQYVGLFIS